MVRATLAAALVAALAACASVQGLVQKGKAQLTLSDALRQYDAGEHDKAAKSFATALELGLGPADQGVAHKNLAFIHCAAGRERQCREEFRKGLAADPSLQLTAAEAGHPVWGPVFNSLSGSAALAAGLKQYENGDYAESAKNLHSAISLGLPDKQRADAHKHLAFIHCSSSRERQCRDEFRRALAIDPALDLAPAEAGHPVWGPIFRAVKSGK